MKTKMLFLLFSFFVFVSCSYDVSKVLSNIGDGTTLQDVTSLKAFERNSQIILRWDEQPSDQFEYIEITCSPGYSYPVIVGKGVKYKLIENLEPGTSYNFTVREVDSIGNKTAGTSIVATPTGIGVPVNGISLDRTSVTMSIGNSFQLNVALTPSNHTNDVLYWSSSNESIATVVCGLVTAHAAGSSSVIVSSQDGGFVAICVITVLENPVSVQSVNLTKTTLVLQKDATEQLVPIFTPENATSQNVTWISSNPSTVFVSDSGYIDAKAAGIATITVTTVDGNFNATCKVTVVAPAVTYYVLFYRDLGDLVDIQTVIPPKTTIEKLPYMPILYHYVFGGWYTGTEKTGINGSSIEFTASMPVTKNMYIYAKWIYKSIYAVRDIGPSGVGTVFYVTNGGLHGLEFSPEDQADATTWSNVTSSAVGASAQSSAIGAGLANSNAIIAQTGHITSAAKLCIDYRGGGLNDWFLPSKDELNQLFLSSILEQICYGNYWTSTEGNSSNAWSLSFEVGYYGSTSLDSKGSTTSSGLTTGDPINVRAIRAF